MSNIYSKWNQGSTYIYGTEIADLPGKPFFIKQNVHKKNYAGKNRRLPKGYRLRDNEKMILYILSAFRSISWEQLKTVLKMTGNNLSATAFTGLIKKMVYFSLVDEISLCYTIDCNRNPPISRKLKVIRTGRNGHIIGKTLGLNGYSVKQLAVLKSSYRNSLANDLTDYVWSQIVIKSLMKSCSIKRFKIDRILHLKGGMTVLIPLTIMTDNKMYLFEYIITNYEWEISCALQKYEHVALSQNQEFTLVLVLQGQNLKSFNNVNKKIKDSSFDIVFTTVSEWFSKGSGSLHRITNEDLVF